MATFGPDLAPEIATACQAGTAEASQALSRALDGSLTLAFEATGTWSELSSKLPAGAGLAIVLHTDAGSALFLVPEASGFLPTWYAAPDPTGTSKLMTLAQELGMLLLPEAYMPLDFAAGKVADCGLALQRGGVVAEAMAATGAASLTITANGQTHPVFLLWPVPQPKTVLEAPKPAPAPPATAKQAPKVVASAPPAERDLDDAIPQLPAYTRSLLKISVTVTVTLAKSKQPVHRIIDLGPGSILQFDKPCDEPLTLCVGDQEIASGEAVKSGEKFGMRITEMIMPGERFLSVRGTRTA